MHFDDEPPLLREALEAGIPDAFVVSGRASSVLHQSALCTDANVPFWLQLVGSGITTSWAAHLGAVCKGASWPAITAMNILSSQLIATPIDVVGGYHRVSERPGLGIEVDTDAVARFRLPPDDPRISPSGSDYATAENVFYAVVYPDASCIRFRGDCRKYFVDGDGPAYAPGVRRG